LNDDLEHLAQSRVGSVLSDKWTIEKLLGVGGMAAVYAARHRNGARAAIKILHPELARNKEVRERFRREGYAANLVEHPGVVRVLDDDVDTSGPGAGAAYLVMELLSGEALQDRLERAPMGEIEFLEIAASVLDVLDVAHTKGVIHRDLKPENLFLWKDEADETPRRRVKILDFGLARLQEGASITTYGLALGTPSFMSPEQAAGRIDEIDGRTDLFALAATGFRIRSGKRIHEAGNPIDLVTKMAQLPAPPLRSVCPEVSAPFERVIDKALQFRRDDRYRTAGEMGEDVRRALTELEGAKTQNNARPGDALPPPAPAMERTAPSIELGDEDIVKSVHGVDESIRIPKRRSVLPWLLLLGVAGGGAKVLYDGRAQGLASMLAHALGASEVGSSEPSAAPAASGGPAPGAAAPIEGDATAATSAPAESHSKPAANVAAMHPLAPAAPAGSAHHRTAPKKRTPASLIKHKGH
jgi:eukaryotic-like serine/threonine-protein kinase